MRALMCVWLDTRITLVSACVRCASTMAVCGALEGVRFAADLCVLVCVCVWWGGGRRAPTCVQLDLTKSLCLGVARCIAPNTLLICACV